MRNCAQIGIDDEIFVDSFAGGGGASTGMEVGLGITVAAAINHDPAAILMHKTNHPYTEHYQASVWDVDPRDVCRGRPVGGAWFSPDCKHFSKAKGAALVDKKIRGLAWITLRWAALVRPRVIFLENVEEFQTWGPVRKGKPVKKLAGTTFRKFIGQLRDLGYEVEWRELVAADYGAPTSRKRFVLIARCDGKPIVWPEPTHAPRDSEAVKSGRLKPWRSAAEIIDWSLPCPSIFDTKEEIKERYTLKAVRPLADNTMRRIIRGVDKFTIKSGQPYIVPTGYGPAPDFSDATLSSVTRDILQKYSPETLENVRLKDDLELSCATSEWLFDGIDTIEGVVALLYTMAWAFAETRERLRMYEETRLSPMDLKDRLIAPFQNDMFAMVWGAFKKLYPDKECEIYWEPQIRDEEDGKPVYGLTDFADDGSVAVFVKPSLEVADAVEILAHELAHVAVGIEHDHDEVWQEAFDKIFEEYNRIGDRMFPNGGQCAMDDPDEK